MNTRSTCGPNRCSKSMNWICLSKREKDNNKKVKFAYFRGAERPEGSNVPLPLGGKWEMTTTLPLSLLLLFLEWPLLLLALMISLERKVMSEVLRWLKSRMVMAWWPEVVDWEFVDWEDVDWEEERRMFWKSGQSISTWLAFSLHTPGHNYDQPITDH